MSAHRVLVVCADLMLASRFSHPTVTVEVMRTIDRACDAVAGGDVALVMVDLDGMAGAAAQIHAVRSGNYPQIIGCAPHTASDVIRDSRPWCDRVLARGAAVEQFVQIVDAATGTMQQSS